MPSDKPKLISISVWEQDKLWLFRRAAKMEMETGRKCSMADIVHFVIERHKPEQDETISS